MPCYFDAGLIVFTSLMSTYLSSRFDASHACFTLIFATLLLLLRYAISPAGAYMPRESRRFITPPTPTLPTIADCCGQRARCYAPRRFDAIDVTLIAAPAAFYCRRRHYDG